MKRYLEQMIGELQALPHPDGEPGSLVDAVELIIPHQANKRMVIDLAEQAGIGRDRMYFNIARVGNTSAASIPLAIHDRCGGRPLCAPNRRLPRPVRRRAVRDTRVLAAPTPAASHGADRAVPRHGHRPLPAPPHTSSSADVEDAFGG